MQAFRYLSAVCLTLALAAPALAAPASSTPAGKHRGAQTLRDKKAQRLGLRANDVFDAPNILHEFGAEADGPYSGPEYDLMQAKDGNFYGIASNGNRQNIIYRITPAGVFAAVYTFSSGTEASSSLVQGADGNLYGTTFTTESTDGTFPAYVYAFNIAKSSVVAMYEIVSVAEAGFTGLVPDTAGNLYGLSHPDSGSAAIYKLTLPTANPPAAGHLDTIYSIDGDADQAAGTPVIASDGKLYLALNRGCDNGNEGGIYSLDLATKELTGLGCIDTTLTTDTVGGPMTEVMPGILYGYTEETTTDNGSEPIGGLFKVNLSTQTPSDVLKFDSSDDKPCDGCALYNDNAGDVLYTTYQGGANFMGSIVNVGNTNTVTTLYTFPADGSTGAYPDGNVLLGPDGNLYGAALEGGSTNSGTFYQFPTASLGYTTMLALTPSVTTASTGQQFTLTWNALNAYSQSAQACFAFSSDSAFNGAQTYNGSATITAGKPGIHTYAINCGGRQTGTAAVTVNAGSIAVTSNGSAVTGGSYNFGAVPENSAVTYTITLMNNGNQAFPLSITKAGTTSANFSVSNDCNGSIAPGSSCDLTATYHAPAGSETDQATFTIAKSGYAFAPTNAFTLTAHSVTPGVITVSSNSHNFGTVATFSTSGYTFQVYNGTGASQPFSLTGRLVTGSAVLGSYTTTCASTLAVDAACSVTYTLTPGSTTGSYEYDITVNAVATVKPGPTVKLTANVTKP